MMNGVYIYVIICLFPIEDSLVSDLYIYGLCCVSDRRDPSMWSSVLVFCGVYNQPYLDSMNAHTFQILSIVWREQR